jgi:hypothetical protein
MRQANAADSYFLLPFTFCFLTFAVVSAASAQNPNLGAGKVEVGGFPMGGAAFVGGDDDTEVNFNVYSVGANLTYYVTGRAAIEGELGINLGLAQDILFKKTEVLHVQLPNVWTYFGNVVFFPGGSTGRHLPYYVTAGAGAVSLQSRQPTKPFGYDVDTVRFETFMAENIGAGVKIFRVDPPDWGFRIDYRYLIVNANSGAPAFFANAKRRTGHRLTFGVLYTWKPRPSE